MILSNGSKNVRRGHIKREVISEAFLAFGKCTKNSSHRISTDVLPNILQLYRFMAH
jgi:hypothetical protein